MTVVAVGGGTERAIPIVLAGLTIALGLILLWALRRAERLVRAVDQLELFYKLDETVPAAEDDDSGRLTGRLAALPSRLRRPQVARDPGIARQADAVTQP